MCPYLYTKGVLGVWFSEKAMYIRLSFIKTIS